MASAIAAFRPSIALLVGFLLIASMALPNAGACDLVQKLSLTWSGSCDISHLCDEQCKSWENAQHGACQDTNGKHLCYCYFCAAATTSAKNKSATISATSAKNKSATISATSAKNKSATTSATSAKNKSATSAKNKP